MMQMLMMMVGNDDDDGEEARSKAMHESAFRSDAGRRVPKRGPYHPKALLGQNNIS
jgi:spore maturation protein CgeB